VISHLQEDVLSLNVAKFMQPLPEFIKAAKFVGLVAGAEESDPRHLRWRLRRSAKGRYKDAKDKRDEAPNGAEPYSGRFTSASRTPLTIVGTTAIDAHTIPLCFGGGLYGRNAGYPAPPVQSRTCVG